MMRKNINANTNTPAVDAPITTLTKCIVARIKFKKEQIFTFKRAYHKQFESH